MALPVLKLRLSEELLQFVYRIKGNKVFLYQLVDLVSTRGHSLLVIILTLPFMTPIPLPGLSLIFGTVIAFAGVRMAFDLPPWIPKRWLARSIPKSTITSIFEKAVWVLRPMERILKPRLMILHQNRLFHYLNGMVLILMGFVLALPLPPGTNFPPALSIIFIGLGTLEKDGLFVLLGYLFFLFNVGAIVAILVLGIEGAKSLFL